MKILWMSDSPTSPSGFGNVTRFVCKGLADLGHEVSILGWQARGGPTPWQNCMLYPVRHNSFGADVLVSYLMRLRPDVLVTLADVWWLTFITHPLIANYLRTSCTPWVLYYPIDGDMGEGRLPPSWVHILEAVDLPIAMSRYGYEVSAANGLSPTYIPHGVETSVFRPPEDKGEAKRALGYEGHFVVFCDARNQPRKQLPRLLEIFRRFAAGKDDVLLHLHCDPDDPAASTPEYFYDLRADIAHLGLGDKVRTTRGMSIGTGLTLAELSAIYQAADVHLLASLGEGFGLPTLQAASAGVVPLASDYTASRELVLGHGEAIRVSHWLEDQFGLRRALIDVDDAVAALERLYGDAELLAAKSRASRSFAEPYDWARIVPQWHDLLQREGARLRLTMRHPAGAYRMTVNSRSLDGPPELAATVRKVLPGLADSTQITFNVVENKAGLLTSEVLRDAQAFERTLTLPVTLPPADPSLTKSRVTGCVYAASVRDVPVLRALSRIFPGLNVWSQEPLDLGLSSTGERTVWSKAVPAGSAAFMRHLAASTLALDLGGAEPTLAAEAARLCVPCIGLARREGQRTLWPELSLTEADTAEATGLARWMLTDQGAAADVCARARQQLCSPADGLATA